MDLLAQYGYVGLFLASFLAATILPLSSEIVLTLLLLNGLNPSLLVMVATIGNVLGAVVNYGLGFYGGLIFRGKFRTASEREVNASLLRMQKYGAASLLLAWAPIIGDPLTVAAGVLRINLVLFFLLVTIGKCGRYVVLSYLILVSNSMS